MGRICTSSSLFLHLCPLFPASVWEGSPTVKLGNREEVGIFQVLGKSLVVEVATLIGMERGGGVERGRKFRGPEGNQRRSEREWDEV